MAKPRSSTSAEPNQSSSRARPSASTPQSADVPQLADSSAVDAYIREITAAVLAKEVTTTNTNRASSTSTPLVPSLPTSVRQAPPTPSVFTPRTPRVDEADAKDGEMDTAPEDGDVAPGFFSGADRIYSRRTTQHLTDLAGLILLVFLALYFTLSGYWFYVEIAKSIADGTAHSLF
eukprot:CAMPEP_0176450514 /NCGR_PEP_ID=MMETSP0127-20121128/27199_1 /TAXON_ID=938130 /ORGANISM="Platyophrya macrostoma, Strain WH" /LENGTH=175 /DNA_ID=CAMNT_0017838219 /DNA_START=44 /DNA_END=571 /DNA_ORIENTATION=-